MNLEELEIEAGFCQLCDLYKDRNEPVFAKGSKDADIMICGMCPGPDENKMGVPFVGTAGKLLDKILIEAYGRTDSVYITNLVKCFVSPGKKLEVGDS